MAISRKRNIEIDLIVDDKQKSKLAGIGTEAQKTGGRFQNLTGGVKAAALGVGALVATKVVAFLGDATQAAMDDAAAQKQLALAMENTVGATESEISAMEEFIDRTARASGVADDELRPAMAELVRTSGDLETAQERLGVAMDISAAKGIPLETITRAIGKAAGGNVGTLGRLGVATKDADGKTLSFEEAMAEAARTMGGATAVAAETAEGKIRRMNVAVDEAKESIGNALIPILTDGAEALTNISTIVEKFKEKLEDIPGPAGEVVSGVTDWLGPFGALEKITGLVVEQMDKVWPATEKVGTAFERAQPHIEDFQDATDDVTQSLEDFETEVRSQVDPIFNLIRKVDDLAAAQQNSADVRDEYGVASPEHREALRKEAEAWLSVRDAQIKAAEEAGLTRDQFGGVLRDMRIFTEDEIALILKDFDRVNDYKFNDKVVRVSTPDFRPPGAPITARAGGGPVGAGGAYRVGESGTELFVPSTNGTIVPNHKLGGSSYSINVNAGMGANGAQIGKEVVEAIKAFERTNGKTWRA